MELLQNIFIDKDIKACTIHKLIFHLEYSEPARVLCDSFIKFQIRSHNVSSFLDLLKCLHPRAHLISYFNLIKNPFYLFSGPFPLIQEVCKTKYRKILYYICIKNYMLWKTHSVAYNNKGRNGYRNKNRNYLDKYLIEGHYKNNKHELMNDRVWNPEHYKKIEDSSYDEYILVKDFGPLPKVLCKQKITFEIYKF